MNTLQVALKHNAVGITVADPGGFQDFHGNPFWNSYTLVEQSDRNSPDWDAVVLLEIIQ